MKYEHINDEVKLKKLINEKNERIKREQFEIREIELRIERLKYETENQLKMTI